MNRNYRLKTALIPITMLWMMFFLSWIGVAQNTAKFPSAVAGNSDLYIATNNFSTTLLSGITSSATSATVASGSGLVSPGFVTIDSEIMAVCQVSGNTLTFGMSACPNVDGRGVDGSAAVSHLAGRAVQGRVVAWQHNQNAAEVKAIEASLGANLSASGGLNVIMFGADRTGASDSTTAFASAVTAALAQNVCVFVPGGTYKLSNASGVASIILKSNSTANGCIRGDGPAHSILLQSTDDGTTIGVQGGRVIVRDLFIGKESGVTGGTAISIYPDVTANGTYDEADRAHIENVSIDYAYCGNLGSDAAVPSCAKPAATTDYLAYGILVQSGAKDSLFHSISHVDIQHVGDGIRFISGGLAGSAGGGAVEASAITDVKIADATGADIRFTSALRITVQGMQSDYSLDAYKLDTQTSGFWTGQPSEGNTFSLDGAEHITNAVDWGSAAAGNKFHAQNTLALNTITMIGSAQTLNFVDSPDNFQVGFHGTGIADGYMTVGNIANPTTPGTATLQINETANVPEVARTTNKTNVHNAGLDYFHLNPYGQSLATGTYTSGGTVAGPKDSVCMLTFTGSVNGTALISLTGTDTIAGGTAFSVIAGGLFTSAPTAATLSAAPSVAPATSCSGSVVVSTLLTMPGAARSTASTFPYDSPAHSSLCGNTSSFSNTRRCRGYAVVTPHGSTAGDHVDLGYLTCGFVNGATDGSTYCGNEVVSKLGSVAFPAQAQGDVMASGAGTFRTNLGAAFACTHGSNATCGVVSLSSGTATVSTTAVLGLATAGNGGMVVNLVLETCSSCGALSVGTVTSGTSFVINSTNGSDASRVYWRLDYIF